jgi:hypothetical protein
MLILLPRNKKSRYGENYEGMENLEINLSR